MSKTKAPSHLFYNDQTTNFFLAHSIGVFTSILCTWILDSVYTHYQETTGFWVYVIFFIFLYMIGSSIGKTRKEIRPLHQVPITVNGKFIGKFAGAGSYLSPYPFGLMFEEEMTEEPKFFETSELQTSDKDDVKVKGGITKVTYIINFAAGTKFTKNIQDIFEKQMAALITTELITEVRKSSIADTVTNLQKALETIGKEMIKADIKHEAYGSIAELCEKSGVLLSSINIGVFNFEDEEDKDAAAAKKRQEEKNAAQKAALTNFSTMVAEYKKEHPKTSQEAAEKIVSAMTGIIPSQNITISGGGNGTGGSAPVVIIQPNNTTK